MTVEMTALSAQTRAALAEIEAAVGPLPCAARPHSGLVHRDGPCRCFVGGPRPEHGGRPLDALLAPPTPRTGD